MARILIGNIKGPQGIPGEKGDKGDVGPRGPAGVPGSVNNTTPIEFTEAARRENLVSGDSIATLFGKQKKWNADINAIAFSGSYNDLTERPTNIESANYLKGSQLPFAGKTIAHLRTTLDDIATYADASRTAIATIRVNCGELINRWNDNSEETLSSGPSYTFILTGTYNNIGYQVWLISVYNPNGNTNYIVNKFNGTWGKIKKIALEEDIPTTPADIGAASAELFETKEYVIPKPETNNIFTSFGAWTFVATKTGKVVTLNADLSGTMEAVSNMAELLTIPEEFHPKINITHNYISQTGTPMILQVTSDGRVLLFNSNTRISSRFCGQVVTYIVD